MGLRLLFERLREKARKYSQTRVIIQSFRHYESMLHLCYMSFFFSPELMRLFLSGFFERQKCCIYDTCRIIFATHNACFDKSDQADYAFCR